MRSDVVVQPGHNLLRKSIPVSIAAADVRRESVWASRLGREPGALATSISDVLWSAGERHNIDLASLNFERVSELELLIPRLEVVKGVELNVVKRASTWKDGLLAVEENKHVVSILDVSLACSDRDDLVLCELLLANEFFHVVGIFERVAL